MLDCMLLKFFFSFVLLFVNNLILLFPVIDNRVITSGFLFAYLFFFLSATGRGKITLVIFMEKSFLKKMFNRFIF